MIKLTEDRFAELAREAVDSLPPELRDRMENVTIDVQPLPDEQTCAGLGLDSPYHLFGLYHGIPLTQRSVEILSMQPDRITIYQESIQRASRSEAEVVEQIRTTVLHEIGHFFGLDEDDLDALGYG